MRPSSLRGSAARGCSHSPPPRDCPPGRNPIPRRAAPDFVPWCLPLLSSDRADRSPHQACYRWPSRRVFCGKAPGCSRCPKCKGCLTGRWREHLAGPSSVASIPACSCRSPTGREPRLLPLHCQVRPHCRSAARGCWIDPPPRDGPHCQRGPPPAPTSRYRSFQNYR